MNTQWVSTAERPVPGTGTRVSRKSYAFCRRAAPFVTETYAYLVPVVGEGRV